MNNKHQNDTFLYELRDVPDTAFRVALKNRLNTGRTNRLAHLFTPRRTRTLAFSLALLLVVLAWPRLRSVLRVDASGLSLQKTVTLNLDGYRYKIILQSPEQAAQDQPLSETLSRTCTFSTPEVVEEAFARDILSFELVQPTDVPSPFGDQQIKLLPVGNCGQETDQHFNIADGYYDDLVALQWRDLRADVPNLQELQMFSSHNAFDMNKKNWLAKFIPWGADSLVTQVDNRWRGFTVERLEVAGRRVGILDWYDQSEPPKITLRTAYWYQDGVVHQISAESIDSAVIVPAAELIKMIKSTQ